MTNEYDGMSGYSREDLWFDADRTRVLPAVHQERVDGTCKAHLKKRRISAKERQGCQRSGGLIPMAIDFRLCIRHYGACCYPRALGVFVRGSHSLLSMMTFFAVAGLMVLAHAEMLAAIQILVYLGSVMLVVTVRNSVNSTSNTGRHLEWSMGIIALRGYSFV